MLYRTHGIYFVYNNACVLLIDDGLIGKHCLIIFFQIKWPHTEFALLNFSYELLIVFGGILSF